MFVTVDAPALGRREKDMRNKYTKAVAVVQHDANVNRNQGAARALSSFIDPSLCWNDIAWLKSLSDMKIALKGIQVSLVLAREIEEIGSALKMLSRLQSLESMQSC